MTTLLGCNATTSNPAPTVSAAEFTGNGYTYSDLAIGQERLNAAVIACLREKGFDLKGPTPRIINESIVSGEGPVTVALNDVEHPEMYTVGADPSVKRAPGFVEASDSCLQAATQARAAKMSAVLAIDQRLSTEWSNFQTSQPYTQADANYGKCLASAGQSPETLLTTGSGLKKKVEAIVDPPGGRGTDTEVATKLKELLPQESALRVAATTCWASEMKPTLQDYQAKLWQENSEDILQLASAIRGDE